MALTKRAILFLVVLLVFFLTSCGSTAGFKNDKVAGIGVSSNGYRMGQLSKFSIKGFLIKSGEGTILLGNDSVPHSFKTVDDVETVINPWHFSSDVDGSNKFTPFVGDAVWIRYNHAQVSSNFFETPYMGQEVAPVTKVPSTTCGIQPAHGGLNNSTGVRVGRIVKASSKGISKLNETWEVILQEGNSGSKFVEMSIVDKSIYDCAVQSLKSGLPVKAYYTYTEFSFALSWSKTGYRINAISPVQAF